jgi:hypothetical protein
VDVRDVRMIEGRENFSFSLEARQSVGARCQRHRENLDRDLALQLRVSGSIHLAHPTGSHGGDDLKRAEAGAGREGQNAMDYTWVRGAEAPGDL